MLVRPIPRKRAASSDPRVQSRDKKHKHDTIVVPTPRRPTAPSASVHVPHVAPFVPPPMLYALHMPFCMPFFPPPPYFPPQPTPQGDPRAFSFWPRPSEDQQHLSPVFVPSPQFSFGSPPRPVASAPTALSIDELFPLDGLKLPRESGQTKNRYQCPFCSRVVQGRSGLKRHMRTHTGEKPFVCEECGRGFSQKGTLRSHLDTHRGDTPFKCDICGARFKHRGSARRHQARHGHLQP